MEDKLNLDLEDFSSEPFLDELVKEITENDPSLLIGIFVAIAVVIITIVLLKFLLGSKKKRNAVLLVGLCDAGKTLLFSRLLVGKLIQTVTSSKDSKAPYRAKNEKGTTWTLVDIPGHDSLRSRFLEKFMESASFCLSRVSQTFTLMAEGLDLIVAFNGPAIVFVVDSSMFQKEVKEVAEFLYTLLTDSVLMNNAPTFLIACNKQDINTAKSAKLIQQQLEKELTTLRLTRSAALTSQDGSVRSVLYLGKKGKDFEFSQLPVRVEFLECSARSSDKDADAKIEALEKSLAKL